MEAPTIDTDPIVEVSPEPTPEQLSQFLESIQVSTSIGRAQLRANAREIRKATSKLVRAQQLNDSKLVVRQRAKLRRRFGNPAKRREALIAWFVAENAKRGFE